MQHCRNSPEREKGKAGYVFLVDDDAIGSRRQRAIHVRQSKRFGECQRRLLAPRRHHWASPLALWRGRGCRWRAFNAKGEIGAATTDLTASGFLHITGLTSLKDVL